mgnify:CR=1 FL=1
MPDLVDYGVFRLAPTELPETSVGAPYHQVISTLDGSGVVRLTYKVEAPMPAAEGVTFVAHDGSPGTLTLDFTPAPAWLDPNRPYVAL